MNHKAIVCKQLNEEAVALREQLARIEAGIVALGGTVNAGGSSSPKRRRGRGKARTPAGAATPARTTAAAGNDPPELQTLLRANSARTDLTPIGKAQAARKIRLQFRNRAAAQPTQGANLAEAASVA